MRKITRIGLSTVVVAGSFIGGATTWSHIEPAHADTQPWLWHGFDRGEVIVCDSPLIVAIDDYSPGDDPAMPHGGQWASCQ